MTEEKAKRADKIQDFNLPWAQEALGSNLDSFSQPLPSRWASICRMYSSNWSEKHSEVYI